MSRALAAAFVVVAAAALAPAVPLAPPNRLSLVRAQCAGPPPGPCAPAFAFTRGTAVISSQRQPKPACPRTGMPTETAAGTVVLTGVTKDGTPFEGSLPVEVLLNTTFGRDSNGNCELSEFNTGPFPSMAGSLQCRRGKCRGQLFPVACLPKNCADAAITSEFVSLRVLDDGPEGSAQPIATVGTAVAPAPSDAP